MPKKPKPNSVVIFGLLNLAFAILGLGGSAMAVLFLCFGSAESENPAIYLLHRNEVYYAWSWACVAFGGVTSVFLAAAGVGVLYLRPWARRLSIAWAWCLIVWTPVGTVFNYLYLARPILEAVGSGRRDPTEIGAMIGALIGVGASLFSLVYPIVIVAVMSRKGFRAHFEADEGGATPDVVEGAGGGDVSVS